MEKRSAIKNAIERGDLLCEGCPMQGVKEGYFAGDVEVSKACWLCGAVEGHMTGSIDDLIDQIGEDKLAYLLSE